MPDMAADFYAKRLKADAERLTDVAREIEEAAKQEDWVSVKSLLSWIQSPVVSMRSTVGKLLKLSAEGS